MKRFHTAVLFFVVAASAIYVRHDAEASSVGVAADLDQLIAARGVTVADLLTPAERAATDPKTLSLAIRAEDVVSRTIGTRGPCAYSSPGVLAAGYAPGARDADGNIIGCLEDVRIICPRIDLSGADCLVNITQRKPVPPGIQARVARRFLWPAIDEGPVRDAGWTVVQDAGLN